MMWTFRYHSVFKGRSEVTGVVVLQQLTEAAVAKERAKLYAEMKDRVMQQAAAGSEYEVAVLRTRHALHPEICLLMKFQQCRSNLHIVCIPHTWTAKVMDEFKSDLKCISKHTMMGT